MAKLGLTKVFVVAAAAVVACGPSTPAPAPMPTVTARPQPVAVPTPSVGVPDAAPPPAVATCTPNATFCSEGNVRKCTADGTNSDMVSACGGDECQLSKTGPVCAACAPGSVPMCKDDATVAVCNDDGTQALTDCSAQKKQCANGVCVDRACEPGQLLCREGNVFRCNAFGSASTLETKCRPAEGVCWSDAARKPACRTQCVGVGFNSVLATFDCAECDFSSVPFCAKKAADHGCGSALCQGGQIGYGADPMPCVRETEGLIVPDSEKRGDCQGDGAVGSATVSYQVCRGGAAVAATRTAPCQK